MAGDVKTVQLAQGSITSAPTEVAVVANESELLQNVGVSIAMAANAVTFALKQSDGSTDASSSQQLKIAFRSATLTTGGYVLRSLTSSSSMTVPDTATLGTTSANEHRIYLYAIDNSGTIEEAMCGIILDEGKLHTTTAISTGADSYDVLYSTTQRTDVAIRLIGYFDSTQATAGTWATAATRVFTGKWEDVAKINYTAKTANYTIKTTDELVMGDASGGTFTFTMYSAAGLIGHKGTWIKNVGASGYFTLDGNGSETIEGAASVYLSAGQSCYVVPDGTNIQVMYYKPLVGYLRETQTSGTEGGGFTSGSFAKRTLNASSGDFSKFGTLASSVVTLDPGNYDVEGWAQAASTGENKLKWYNSSDTSDDIIGQNNATEINSVTVDAHSTAHLRGRVTITAQKNYELQHRCTTTRATDGLGSACSYSVAEVYAEVKITKRL